MIFFITFVLITSLVCSCSSLSDFMVKVVEMSDSSQQKTLRGHSAPVLSVTFDPKDEFLVGIIYNVTLTTTNLTDFDMIFN